jgi:hypothetical protein
MSKENEPPMSVDEAIDVVVSAADRNRRRLQRGGIRRTQMIKEIEEGRQPTGPRAEFIRDTAQAIMDLLVESSKEFNEANQDDMISTLDFQDVLATVRGRLEEAEAAL